MEERKNKGLEKQNRMQSSGVLPPHVSRAVFLSCRVIHRKALAHGALYLNTKGNISAISGARASETNGRFAHHHGENVRWALHWLMLLM